MSLAPFKGLCETCGHDHGLLNNRIDWTVGDNAKKAIQIDEIEADLKAAFANADHWMTRKEECARENAKLACLLDDADDKAEHWEKTCHAQWKSSQQAVDDCNSFSSALAAIKDAGSKGEMRRIAMQALGETDNYIAGTKTVSNYKIRKQKESEGEK